MLKLRNNILCKGLLFNSVILLLYNNDTNNYEN